MRLVIKNSRYLWFALLPSSLIFFLGAAAALTVLVTGIGSGEEAALAFLVMTCIALAVLILVGGPYLFFSWLERQRILSLINGETWACWPQYASDAEWHAFAQQDYDAAIKRLRFPLLSVVLMVVLFTFISGFVFNLAASEGTNLLLVSIPLGAFFSFVLIVIMGGYVMERGNIRRTYQRRLRTTAPLVYINRGGLYHDDEGYQAFRGWNEELINVYVQEGQPTTLNFQMYFTQRYGAYHKTLSVRVPPGDEAEAHSVAQRFFAEKVVKR
ncbi:MAG: hypothetical protein HXY40_17895 [Chloroflexi bacterium]|nr:hypothetical protein [Chloroflexota bacterium]